MYAVIEAGGRQFKVAEGQELDIEKLTAEVGEKVEFPVLLVADGDQVTVGAPYVTNGKVNAEVIAHGRGDKVKIVKMRRRKHYRKQMGHRQWFTTVKITGIQG